MPKFASRRTLSFRIVSSLLIVFGLGLLALILAGHNAIRIVDQSSLDRQQRMATRSLAAAVASLPEQQRSATIWDDAIRNVAARNEKWIDANLGVWMQEYFGHHESYVLDEENKPVFSSVSGEVRAPETFETRADAIAPLVAQLRSIMAEASEGQDNAFEELADVAVVSPVRLAGEVALVSVVPIISDTGEIPQLPETEPLHIAVRYVDDVLAQEVGQAIELDETAFQSARPDEDLAGVALADLSNNILSWLVWKPYRPGMDLFLKMFPALVIFGLAGGAVLFWLVRRLVGVSGQLEASEAQAHLDVIALNKARQEAEAADRAKLNFLSVLSHELRTPLTVILGFSRLGKNMRQLPSAKQLDERLNLRPADVDDIRGSVDEVLEFTTTAMEKIDKSGEHLLFLVNQLLDYAKLETGSMKIDPEICDVEKVIEPVVAQMSILAEQKGLRLETSLISSLIWADVTRTRQILINLLGNSIKFTESGKISVVVTETENQVHIDVSDTGAGIKPEELDRIFEPFHQIDSSSTRSVEGTGLGLAVVKELAELEGGTIEVRSEVGVGSTFTLSLPKETSARLEMAV
ncbi:sensor histidine kinase [Roseovarius sp. B08]|uniref:sensor histidine kinase n=1 Tax=Roseovarius sp. B08 TaxID=3449223 RepID=UPI003EDC87D5